MTEETRLKLYGSVITAAMQYWEKQGYRISFHGDGFAVVDEKMTCFLEFKALRVKITSYLNHTNDVSDDKIDEFNMMDVDSPAHKIFETVNEHLQFWQQKGGDMA